MSELDKALGALQARRSQDEAERQRRRTAACEFLKEFYEADIRSSKRLKEHGIESECDGIRLVLERPSEGHFSEGLLIVIGEQGEIDVGGKSLGRYQPADKAAKKSELIMEIITHFSL
jgi:transposase